MDNKTFVSKLARMTGCDNREVTDLINGLGNIIKERASELDSIAIPGFGNFVAMKKQERISYDTATGKRMLIPPKITVEFVAGSGLKKQVAHE